MKFVDVIYYLGQHFPKNTWRYAWSKSYDNNTKLFEIQRFNSSRGRKCIGFLQISFYDDISNNVICCEYTALNKERTHIEISNINDLDKVLNLA